MDNAWIKGRFYSNVSALFVLVQFNRCNHVLIKSINSFPFWIGSFGWTVPQKLSRSDIMEVHFHMVLQNIFWSHKHLTVKSEILVQPCIRNAALYPHIFHSYWICNTIIITALVCSNPIARFSFVNFVFVWQCGMSAKGHFF